jgi:CHASE3 domain sensor protein
VRRHDQPRHAACLARAHSVHDHDLMNAITTTPSNAIAAPGNGAGELIHRIADDVKTIARDEVELVTQELAHTARVAAADAAVVVLGGIVALIGFGLLCVAAVVAIEPLIGSLALRLVIMAAVYMSAGGVIAAKLAVKLKRDMVPNLSLAITEAKHTVEDIKQGLAR